MRIAVVDAAAFLLLTLATPARSQDLSGLPTCAQPCLDEAIQQQSICDPTDFVCLCKPVTRASLVDGFTSCVAAECSPLDILESTRVINQFCLGVGQNETPVGTTIEPPNTATPHTTARAPTQSSGPTLVTSRSQEAPLSTPPTGLATVGTSTSVLPNGPKESTTSRDTQGTSGGLSTGATAGIAVGVVAVVAIVLAGAIYLFLLRRRKKRATDDPAAPGTTTSPQEDGMAVARGYELDPEPAKGGGGGTAVTELRPESAKVGGVTGMTELSKDTTVAVPPPPELSATTKWAASVDGKSELPTTTASAPTANQSASSPVAAAYWGIANDSGRTATTSSSQGPSPPYVELSTERPEPMPSELYTSPAAQVPSELYTSPAPGPSELYTSPSYTPSELYTSPPQAPMPSPGPVGGSSDMIAAQGQHYAQPPPMATTATSDQRLAEADLEQLLREEEELERRRKTLVELRSVEEEQAALRERIKAARAQSPL